ncbi:MAG: hypothetical protein NTY47_07230, partial [Candidatus Omnitrophica bacterium]|nr:hypothetical protein [Candidatus Omnitrophota bacterium]
MNIIIFVMAIFLVVALLYSVSFIFKIPGFKSQKELPQYSPSQNQTADKSYEEEYKKMMEKSKQEYQALMENSKMR